MKALRPTSPSPYSGTHKWDVGDTISLKGGHFEFTITGLTIRKSDGVACYAFDSTLLKIAYADEHMHLIRKRKPSS